MERFVLLPAERQSQRSYGSGRVAMGATTSATAIDAFHELYYDGREQTWGTTFWLGHRALKCPFDLWIYQEILYEVQPELIIETGTYLGGSALFLASICDLLGHGEVVTIDADRREGLPRHPRITYLTGSSTSRGVLGRVRERAKGKSPVMVILDSDHKQAHVSRELAAYAPLVTPGSYLVVEDTNINGHPVDSRHGPGPAEAVAEFLARNEVFVRDASREKLLLTFNPGGYLKKRSIEDGAPAAQSRRDRLRRFLRLGRR
jgi:cephalosporin hydroxylase